MAVILEGMRTYSVNVTLYDYQGPTASPNQSRVVATSGDYRSGFCYVEPTNLQRTPERSRPRASGAAADTLALTRTRAHPPTRTR